MFLKVVPNVYLLETACTASQCLATMPALEGPQPHVISFARHLAQQRLAKPPGVPPRPVMPLPYVSHVAQTHHTCKHTSFVWQAAIHATTQDVSCQAPPPATTHHLVWQAAIHATIQDVSCQAPTPAIKHHVFCQAPEAPRPWCLQVLHTRSRSGTGLHFVRFLAACYLTFNMDCDSVAKAQETLPTLPTLRRAIAPGQWGCHSSRVTFQVLPFPFLFCNRADVLSWLVWQLVSPCCPPCSGLHIKSASHISSCKHAVRRHQTCIHCVGHI